MANTFLLARAPRSANRCASARWPTPRARSWREAEGAGLQDPAADRRSGRRRVQAQHRRSTVSDRRGAGGRDDPRHRPAGASDRPRKAARPHLWSGTARSAPSSPRRSTRTGRGQGSRGADQGQAPAVASPAAATPSRHWPMPAWRSSSPTSPPPAAPSWNGWRARRCPASRSWSATDGQKRASWGALLRAGTGRKLSSTLAWDCHDGGRVPRKATITPSAFLADQARVDPVVAAADRCRWGKVADDRAVDAAVQRLVAATRGIDVVGARTRRRASGS